MKQDACTGSVQAIWKLKPLSLKHMRQVKIPGITRVHDIF